MTLTLGMITMDTDDPEALGGWWAEQMGAAVVQNHEGAFVVVAGGTLPALMAFQKVPDPTPGKNKVHLDLTADDLEAEVERLTSVGATLVERRGDDSFRWITMADPQGNHFCVAARAEADASY